MLKFSSANAKTKALYDAPGVKEYLENKRKVYSLDLASGWSCPGAKDCLSKATTRTDDPTRFTIIDGPSCQFRCFSASQEIVYPSVRKLRRHNFDVLRKMRGKKQCFDMLATSLPHNIGVLRYHASGDFFKLAYLQAALKLAQERPDVLFYAYTKSLHHLVKLGVSIKNGVLAKNFMVTASRGGKFDNLIDTHNLREAKVVLSEGEAKSLNLPIDHTDEHAATKGGSFALLIHGVQPKGSDASKALVALKGKGTYARK